MKAKDRVLIFLAKLSVVLMIVSGCALDSESDLPLIICGVSMGYLALFIFANTKD